MLFCGTLSKSAPHGITTIKLGSYKLWSKFAFGEALKYRRVGSCWNLEGHVSEDNRERVREGRKKGN